MLYLRWILITLVVILNILNIKASETEKVKPQGVSPPTKALGPGDSLETLESTQSQGLELEKKRRAFKPEAEKKKEFEAKKNLGSVEERDLFSTAESQYHVQENLDKYISRDEKYVYSRIQTAMEALVRTINELNHYLRPGLNLDSRKEHLNIIFPELPKSLSTVPVLQSFAQEIEINLGKTLKEEEEHSNHNGYADLHAQLMEYCTRLRLILEQELKTLQADQLEDFDLKSTMNSLMKTHGLLNPESVAERLYKFIKSHTTVENGFEGITRSFQVAKASIKKFWKRALDVDFWKESNETHGAQLEACWAKGYIQPAFNFILHILIGTVAKSSELGIPIVNCAKALQVYMDQVENAFWRCYASEITDFNAHYRLTAEQIASYAMQFIESCPNKEKAIAVVKDVVIEKPRDFFKAAFKGGEVNQEILRSSNNPITALYVQLEEEYGYENDNYIKIIYDKFLLTFIDNLVAIGNQGIKIYSSALLNSTELRLNSIWAVISKTLEKAT